MRVLLVEDNRGDAALISEELMRMVPAARLQIAHDGLEAGEQMRSADGEIEVVILDLNLPGIDGWRVLANIRQDPMTTVTPVVVLTSSEDEHDVNRAYRLGANCYLVKPIELSTYLTVVRQIADFWLRMSQLPSGPADQWDGDTS
ncbi:response regulator [Mangrovihabitans endophyticus]|uniref:Response regulator n=1 Tax=Mangrovihabitans endophyticus TaxID=1751298 RepID=A0A8J3C0T9_9ACTN|nr:response regulator [Mangrovihabitans endophyticus]GGK94205.1 response regulator [Mangrovihabitans endophyticus]